MCHPYIGSATALYDVNDVELQEFPSFRLAEMDFHA